MLDTQQDKDKEHWGVDAHAIREQMRARDVLHVREPFLGAFYTLVPIRPRRRGERRSLRTFAVLSLRPPLAFNPRPRRL